MSFTRIQGKAEAYLRACPKQRFDLILTSPPAYPVPLHCPGTLGKEPTLDAYLKTLCRTLFQCRHALHHDGFLVLVLEQLPGFPVANSIRLFLKRLGFRVVDAYAWHHNPGSSSVMIFTRGKGTLAATPARDEIEWRIPRPRGDAAYGFYEWPQGLVDTITALTLPTGGRILDPFCGKATALQNLPPEFDVTGVDEWTPHAPTPTAPTPPVAPVEA